MRLMKALLWANAPLFGERKAYARPQDERVAAQQALGIKEKGQVFLM
jgi:hypothetical protein